MNKKRNINFKLPQNELEDAIRIKEEYGFSTLTGMLKFMLSNAESVMLEMFKKHKR